MTQPTLTWGTTVHLDGQPVRLVEIQGGSIAVLFDEATSEYRRMPFAEVWRQLDTTDLATVATGPRLGTFDTLGKDERSRIIALAGHVRELDDATPPEGQPGDTPRPAFDPSLPMGQRLRSKVAELAGTPHEMTDRSLRTKVTQYRQFGVEGLVDGRRTRAKTGLGNANPLVLDIVRDVLTEQRDRSTRTTGWLVEQISGRIGSTTLDLPSESTLRRLIKHLDRGLYATGNAPTRRTAAKRPKRLNRKVKAARPGAVVEIDSTKLDLECLTNDGQAVRPHLTIMVDVATRSILAWALSEGAATSVDHALLLARTIRPIEVRPGAVEQSWMNSRVLPPELMAEVKGMHPDAAVKPYILPASITVDWGADFHGQTFKAACAKYGIELLFAKRGSPTDKPHVERTFHSIKTGFVQRLPGFTGGAVHTRGTNDGPLLTLTEVDALLTQWVVNIYQNTPHQGLAHVYPGVREVTPNQAFTAMFDATGGLALPFSERDYIELMPREQREAGPVGVQLNSRYYDSLELNDLRGKSGPHAGKWEVRFDPFSPVVAWLYDPLQDKYIELRDRNIQQSALPFAGEVTRSLRQSDGAVDLDAQRRDLDRGILEGVKGAEGRAKVKRRNPGTDFAQATITAVPMQVHADEEVEFQPLEADDPWEEQA